MIKVRGLYKPGDTPYRIYEALLSNGDTHTAGAFSKNEFLRDVSRYGEEVVSVRCLDETDIGDGWKEVTAL